jgi:hypothetical protein
LYFWGSNPRNVDQIFLRECKNVLDIAAMSAKFTNAARAGLRRASLLVRECEADSFAMCEAFSKGDALRVADVRCIRILGEEDARLSGSKSWNVIVGEDAQAFSPASVKQLSEREAEGLHN